MNESLRKLRLAAKMTQEDLAEKMNVSRQSVAKWESGESVPDITKCNELAKIFYLEINDIANLFIPQTEGKTLRPKNKYVFGVSKIVLSANFKVPGNANDLPQQMHFGALASSTNVSIPHSVHVTNISRSF